MDTTRTVPGSYNIYKHSCKMMLLLITDSEIPKNVRKDKCSYLAMLLISR